MKKILSLVLVFALLLNTYVFAGVGEYNSSKHILDDGTEFVVTVLKDTPRYRKVLVTTDDSNVYVTYNKKKEESKITSYNTKLNQLRVEQ